MEEKVTFDEFKKALFIIVQYRKQNRKYKTFVHQALQKYYKKGEFLDKFCNIDQSIKLLDSNCSNRLINVVKTYFICNFDYYNLEEIRVKDLSKISEKRFSKFRNAGAITVKELKELCFCTGVTLQP